MLLQFCAQEAVDTVLALNLISSLWQVCPARRRRPTRETGKVTKTTSFRRPPEQRRPWYVYDEVNRFTLTKMIECGMNTHHRGLQALFYKKCATMRPQILIWLEAVIPRLSSSVWSLRSRVAIKPPTPNCRSCGAWRGMKAAAFEQLPRRKLRELDDLIEYARKQSSDLKVSHLWSQRIFLYGIINYTSTRLVTWHSR